MKNVTQYVEELSEDDLALAVTEIYNFHQTAILSDGVVRSLTQKVSAELNISPTTIVQSVESAVKIRAAMLWVKSKSEIEELRESAAWLNSLEGAGVDNWDGYDYAREIFQNDYPEYNND